ncbi:hypothetical protein HBI47_114890 [Parastagonospora nodorum]|nr:hypothetical protein HBI47_114890 [Parastagonospora nodorum]
MNCSDMGMWVICGTKRFCSAGRISPPTGNEATIFKKSMHTVANNSDTSSERHAFARIDTKGSDVQLRRHVIGCFDRSVS